MSNYLFQYCQKIVMFRNDDTQVLLCKRKGEQDYDGIYSFIGGKMETTDENIIIGLQREKNEEVGEQVKADVLIDYNSVAFFRKKDGNSMVLPHYYASYKSGEIVLNDEYSDYKRVNVADLAGFEPKIETIPGMVKKLLDLKNGVGEKAAFVEI